ncbi:MAG: hypothetical protein M3Y06_07225 [Actinomycetota bacterium]|nr:hypothetical protein [Actinomycetota bacterium]
MSVTTFGDLLTDAEQVLIALARQRVPDALALAIGWPDFSRRAVHAITAATGARDPRWYAVDRLIVELSRPVRSDLGNTDVALLKGDLLLERAGFLLGAAGDVLASAHRDSVADPMLEDANVKAAQARVAALLAAAAHSSVRALWGHEGSEILSSDSARQIAGSLMWVERLATGVVRSSPTLESRADDVAVVSVQPGKLSLEDAAEVWGWEARASVRGAHPSARDLQALAADLSKVATHSRAIARAAVAQLIIDPDRGAAADRALADVAAGWLDIARGWNGLHTTQPPTPAKIAASHALGQALIAVTRDGRDWAGPALVGKRVDVARALGVVRRSQDVGHDVADALVSLPGRLAESGMLFAPARLLTPTLDRLKARLHGELVPAARQDVVLSTTAVLAQQQRDRRVVNALTPGDARQF